MHRVTSRVLPLVAFAATVLLAAGTSAWTGPTGSPPNSNVAAPINTGSSGQVKQGDFGILGNLGVGTPSPAVKLDVTGGNLIVRNTWSSSDNVEINGNQIWNTAGGNDLYLQWSNGGGGVTIGNGTTAANLTLGNGAVKATQFCIGVSCITSWANTSPWTSSGGNVSFTGGNVSIGVTTPVEALDIGQNKTIFLEGNSNSWGYKINVNDYGSGNVPLRFIKRNGGTDSEVARFDQSGNLGIGTTNPGQKLEVNGAVKATQFCIGASCVSSWAATGVGGSGTNGYVPRYTPDGSTLGNSSITSDGSSATANGNFFVTGTVYASPTYNQFIPFGNGINTSGIVRLSGASTQSQSIQFVDPGAQSAFLGLSGGVFSLLRGCGTGSTSACALNGYQPLAINLGTNAMTVGGPTTVNGAVTASQFCIGASCLSSWPSAGIAGISVNGTGSYNNVAFTGAGVSVSGNTVTIAGSSGVGGSGTSGYVPRLTAASTIGNSSITNDGTNTSASGTLTLSTGNLIMTKSSPEIQFLDSTGRSTTFTVSGSAATIKRGCGNGSNLSCPLNNGPQPFSINLDTNDALFGGKVTATTNVTAPQFCIGVSCISSWAAASTGAYLPIYAGYNSSGVGDGGAAIYNDNGSFKKLMIVGNNSGGGSREVGIWDNLTVNGDATVTGAVYATNWLRPRGQTGIYFQDYLSGLYMTDTLWIRSYGAAGLWMGNGNIGTNGCVTIGFGGTGCNAGEGKFSGAVTATSFLNSSDRRLKENITPIPDALSKVAQITGVSFTWRPGTPRAGKEDIGVIAQDVQKVAPEAVQTESDGYLAVDYPKLVPLLVNAINEQQKEIDALKADIEALKNK